MCRSECVRNRLAGWGTCHLCDIHQQVLSRVFCGHRNYNNHVQHVSQGQYSTLYWSMLLHQGLLLLYSWFRQVYGHYGLPRYHGNRSFTNRCDTDLVNLVRTCSKLHTLVIRDRISTCTLILIAREGKSLRRLYVRRSGIIKRCDWQRTITWDDEYYWTMRRASHCYDATFTEVSRRLGYNWEPLSDKAFMELSPPHCEMTVSSDFDTS